MTQTVKSRPLVIRRPDDWHVHLRDGPALKTTVPHSAMHFGRILCMPNTLPPITTCAHALAYRERILAHNPTHTFDPKMALYLTDITPPDEINRLKESPHILAVKYYPAGATTNSYAGVTDIRRAYPVLERMQQLGVPLLLHGEITRDGVDIFDREQYFIDEVLSDLVKQFPALKISLEHITTQAAVAFVSAAGPHIVASITPQHLLFNRNDMLVGGIRPHFYCLPILKRSTHQLALQQAATSGSPKFFLGTDSAPHAKHTKEAACGCAGCYSAPIALALYAQLFDQLGQLDKLEAFASLFGAQFYGLAPNHDTITLMKQPHTVPASYPYSVLSPVDAQPENHTLIPLMNGETLSWQVIS